MPTVKDVIGWLPQNIEELVVAKNPPPPTYRGYLDCVPTTMKLCPIPSMPEDLLKELDLITFKTGGVGRDISDISGAWKIDIQLDHLPRFSGRHKIELQSFGGKIAGSFYPEERSIYRVEGKEIAPDRIAFTMLVGSSGGEENYGYYTWIEFQGDVVQEDNRIFLVGSYIRFDRDNSDGHIRKKTGHWRAEQESREACWTKDLTLYVRGRGEPKVAKGSSYGLFEDCQIFLLKRPINFNLRALSNRLRKLHGLQVVVWHERWGKETYFLAQPSPNVLLVATSEDYIATTIHRMLSKPKDRAMPSSLPEWQHISNDALHYAIRHYKPKPENTNSIYRKVRDPFINIPLEFEDDGLIGFSVAESTYKPTFIDIHYFSSNSKGSKFLMDEIRNICNDGNRRQNFVTLKAPSKNCRQIRITTSNDDERLRVCQFFRGMLGFASTSAPRARIEKGIPKVSPYIAP